MEIYAININDIDENDYKYIKNYLHKEKVERIEKFIFFKDKVRGALGEVLVRLLISKKFNIEYEKVEMKKNFYGKPYIEDSEVSFNISHSGEWVVVAIDNENIGIDVENIDGGMNYNELIPNVFTEKEQEFINYYSEDNKRNIFYKLWTLKESYVKLIGKGLSIPLKSFDIENEKDEIYWKTKCDFYNRYAKYKNYNIDSEYVISVCSFKDKFPLKIKKVDLEFIFNKLIDLKKAV